MYKEAALFDAGGFVMRLYMWRWIVTLH